MEEYADPEWVRAWCVTEEDARIVQSLLNVPELVVDLDELHVFQLEESK